MATVNATASGGVSPYTFQWANKETGAFAIYIFPAGAAPANQIVSETDADSVVESDTATITAESSSAQAYSGSSDPAPFEVPFGGDMYFVWGNDDPVTASSGDSAVVAVSVDAPAIRVMGVGLGETQVVINTDAGQLSLPVVVQ